NQLDWHGVSAGMSALISLVPLLRLPVWYLVSRAGLALTALFVIIATVAYVRSVVLSNRAAPPDGFVSMTALRRETALAVGLVAGLSMGALLTAGVIDAFPGRAITATQTSPKPPADILQWTDVETCCAAASSTGKVLKIQHTIWLGA